MATETLTPAIEWLQSLSRFGIKPGLERTIRVLDAFGRPQDGLKFYHVAGTNGKGSVCAILAQILSVGLKVGVYTSPAFDGYRGRFMVHGNRIAEVDFDRIATQVMEVSARVTSDDPLTEFEALTIMAILYFQECKVEAVVWETGLGGRYDTTNVVMPVVSAITNVSFDHMEILGDTIGAIAYEKAGIIKPYVPVVTATTDEAYRVIEGVAKEQESPCITWGRSFNVIRETMTVTHQRVTYRGMTRDIGGIDLPLFGAHQCQNLAVALAMYEVGCWLGQCPIYDDVTLRSAIRQVEWPGRFEVHRTASGTTWVLDGAHNRAGAERFAASLREYGRLAGVENEDWTMVIGILADKQIARMLKAMLPLAKSVILTAPKSSRRAETKQLAVQVRQINAQIEIIEVQDVEQAVAQSMLQGKWIACWGSLYTVDEARKAIQTLSFDI